MNLRKQQMRAREAKNPAALPTLESITAAIRLPFRPAKDDKGYIHTLSEIGIKCGRKHLHLYQISTIGTALLKCPTCSAGTKFVVMAREHVEDTLDTPFVLNANRVTTVGNSFEFIDRTMTIILLCVTTTGINSAKVTGDKLILRIHKTESIKKINYLLATLGDMPAASFLSAQQMTRINLLEPTDCKFPLGPLPRPSQSTMFENCRKVDPVAYTLAFPHNNLSTAQSMSALMYFEHSARLSSAIFNMQ